MPVIEGGTGDQSLTAYAVVCGGTTGTGQLQSIASVGTAGQVLTSNGAGALPTFQASSAGSPIGFRAHNTVTRANVTGNGTTYTIPFDTIDFEQGGANYNTGTGVYTVPAGGAGVYLIAASVAFNGITGASTNAAIYTTAGGNDYYFQQWSLAAVVIATDNQASMTGATIVQLADADTISIKCICFGMGADTLDIPQTGGGVSYDLYTWFTAYRIGV